LISSFPVYTLQIRGAPFSLLHHQDLDAPFVFFVLEQLFNMKVTQMLSGFVVKAAFLAAAFSTVNGAPKQATTSANNKVVASESVGQTAVRTGAAPVPTVVYRQRHSKH
jgi:hypothetical protein